MATVTDVFYGMCTFWTGDWEWLHNLNRRESPTESIPHCPFCGAPGFELNRETWFEQAKTWEDGTSPKAEGIAHPGYLAMLIWGEKKCFRSFKHLEVEWTAAGRPTP